MRNDPSHLSADAEASLGVLSAGGNLWRNYSKNIPIYQPYTISGETSI